MMTKTTSKTEAWKQRLLTALAIGLIAVPAAAIAGLTAQGLTAQGLTAQGLTAQGLTAQGLTAQGLTAQGLTAQGLTAQGLTAQGLTAQGLTAQGLTAQGLTAQGLTAQGLTAQGADLMGSDLESGELKGVVIGSVDIIGTTPNTTKIGAELTSIPGVSTGVGNYIVTPTADPVVGNYAIAHLLDATGAPAEDISLYIAGQQTDMVPNQFHNADQQNNQDELYIVYFFQPSTGEWISLCPYNVLTQSASAMAIAEDPTKPNNFIFACTATGVASKCARNWGYRPWATTQAYEFQDPSWVLKDEPLKQYYDVCKFAAMADYCQNGNSFTKAGTLVDLFDTRQIIWPNAIQNPFNAANPDSLWMMAQEYFISVDTAGPNPPQSLQQDSALQRTRYLENSPVGQPPGSCDEFTYVTRLEHDNIEDGHWANPLTNTPRVQVFSPTSCTHDEQHTGDVLPWDCTPCTTRVCQQLPQCCGGLGGTSWGASCVAEATALCQDSGVAWPAGKVWPAQAQVSAVVAKYLLGPGGAVLRVDGTSGPSSSASLSGWACDPEWPDASVAVDVYGVAPRGQPGSVLLGEVRADQALASPLLNEVSLACDGPNRSSALHGFSFTLPANQTGSVYVYAIDAATDDGPAAPPTLIRNGIVQVPTCAHSEHTVGDALDASCSVCAGAVCGDGTHAACCTTSWTDDCAAAADACAPTDSSAPTDSRVFAAITTGWLEAPTDGSYLFDGSAEASRLSINGTTVFDWFSGAGTMQGSITLMGGVRYHFRWDRFQAEPPSGSGPGVTWQPPGAVGLGPIPSTALYELAPGSGTGLAATYVDKVSGVPFSRTDATIDINKDVSPPGPPPMTLPATVNPKTGYSAVWEGEIVPAFTEDYTFIVTGSGTPTLTLGGNPVGFPTPAAGSVGAGTCPHDLCQMGDKIAAGTLFDPACDPCVDAVCAQDSYCCDGGYLSYYSTQPVWDAKCVAEVNAYCAPKNQCTASLPSPVSPQQRSSTVSLQAGVHYHLLFAYTNPTGDLTIRLMWSSTRQAKQIVPQFAYFPEGTAPANLGAGMNVTYFATKLVSGVLQPDLTTVIGAGETADLSLTDPPDQEGTPLVTALGAPGDTSVEGPQPPAIVRPRYTDTVAITGGVLDFHGIGGLTGGSVHVKVKEDGTEFFLPTNPDGTFAMNIPVAGTGVKTLVVSQLTYSGSCVPPTFCAESAPVTWPVTITDATSGIAPVITSPKDLTGSTAPVDLIVSVTGSGTPGTVDFADQGLTGVSHMLISPPVADAVGNIAGSLSLSHGTTSNPNPGWHKLVFSQNGAAAAPVFISVGIQPPTVTFPRTGAKIDCSDNALDPREFVATGGLPYPEAQFGRLVVAEETGRLRPNEVIRGDIQVSDTRGPDGLFAFTAPVALDYGRHELYFFQLPPPDPNATSDEIDAEFRAAATVANTPTSRIVVNVPPPRIPIAAGGAILDANGGVLTAGPPLNLNALNFAITNCGPNATAPADQLCVLPFADVNVLVGPRLYTGRADSNGAWTVSAPVPHGWSEVTLSQVVDSPVGGAWQESCPSNQFSVGRGSANGPVVTTPGLLSVNAISPAGAVVSYDVSTAGANGDPVVVDCEPASGSTFPLGLTLVLCTGQDTTTGAVGVARFGVSVTDGPPVVNTPSEIIAEATSSMGALVSWDATATDAVDGTDPVECVPTSPTQFALGTQSVTCTATNSAGETTTASFVVKVEDTTPPTLCPLPNIQTGTGSGAGAFVSFATCASDLVDGSDPVICDHPSGSFFPVGNTVVTCTATDNAGNTSAPSVFTVSVGDTTPPVLTLPANITVTATSRLGARVSYVATATDNVDPHPTVTCTPPSGAEFPLGTTTVLCTATDASGNQSQGTFRVQVIVAWTGFLLPITDGSTRWEHNLPLPVHFALLGASAGISNLTARLYVAPVDASGHVGSEQPVVKLLLGGNQFDFIPLFNQYLLTMDTRPLGIATWQLRVDLGDGQPHATRVTFTR
jgi:hypothetical protein